MHRYEVWIASKEAWKPSSLDRTQSERNNHPSSQSQDRYIYTEGEHNAAIQVSCHGWVHLQGSDTKPSFFLSPQHVTGWEVAQPEASLATTRQVTAAQQRHTTRFSTELSAADKHVISNQTAWPSSHLHQLITVDHSGELQDILARRWISRQYTDLKQIFE